MKISNSKIELNEKVEFNGNTQIADDETTPWLKSKFQIMKNILVISIAWIFLFTV